MFGGVKEGVEGGLQLDQLTGAGEERRELRTEQKERERKRKRDKR